MEKQVSPNKGQIKTMLHPDIKDVKVVLHRLRILPELPREANKPNRPVTLPAVDPAKFHSASSRRPAMGRSSQKAKEKPVYSKNVVGSRQSKIKSIRKQDARTTVVRKRKLGRKPESSVKTIGRRRNKSLLPAKTENTVQDAKVVNPSTCNYCGFVAQTPILLGQHMKMHTTDRPFLCSFCEKRFQSPHLRNQHERVHSGERPYKCKICNYAGTQHQSLTHHLIGHSSSNGKLKCRVCPYWTNTKIVLTKHERTCHEKKGYVGRKREFLVPAMEGGVTTGDIKIEELSKKRRIHEIPLDQSETKVNQRSEIEKVVENVSSGHSPKVKSQSLKNFKSKTTVNKRTAPIMPVLSEEVPEKAGEFTTYSKISRGRLKVAYNYNQLGPRRSALKLVSKAGEYVKYPTGIVGTTINWNSLSSHRSALALSKNSKQAVDEKLNRAKGKVDAKAIAKLTAMVKKTRENAPSNNKTQDVSMKHAPEELTPGSNVAEIAVHPTFDSCSTSELQMSGEGFQRAITTTTEMFRNHDSSGSITKDSLEELITAANSPSKIVQCIDLTNDSSEHSIESQTTLFVNQLQNNPDVEKQISIQKVPLPSLNVNLDENSSESPLTMPTEIMEVRPNLLEVVFCDHNYSMKADELEAEDSNSIQSEAPVILDRVIEEEIFEEIFSNISETPIHISVEDTRPVCDEMVEQSSNSQILLSCDTSEAQNQVEVPNMLKNPETPDLVSFLPPTQMFKCIVNDVIERNPPESFGLLPVPEHIYQESFQSAVTSPKKVVTTLNSKQGLDRDSSSSLLPMESHEMEFVTSPQFQFRLFKLDLNLVKTRTTGKCDPKLKILPSVVLTRLSLKSGRAQVGLGKI